MFDEISEKLHEDLNDHFRNCPECHESKNDEECCEEAKKLIKKIEDFGTGEE